MKVRVSFDNSGDIEEFNSIVSKIDADVRLTGKDEHGSAWNISAKSLLASLLVATKFQKRPHTAHEVDWNTLYCECDEDIYTKIDKFVVLESD